MEILTLIMGPLGALALCLVILWIGYKTVLPIFKAFLSDILTEHKEDRKAFLKTIDLLSGRMEKIEDNVDDVKGLLQRHIKEEREKDAQKAHLKLIKELKSEGI